MIITRRGKPVARLGPLAGGFNRAKALKAAEGLRAASKGVMLGGPTLRAIISEGRR